MSTLYIYTLDDYSHVATIYGPNNEICESHAEADGFSPNDYGWTYTPAFGSVSEMFAKNPRAQQIDASY